MGTLSQDDIAGEGRSPRTQIAVAIVRSRDRFLVGVRAEGTDLARYDEFPGGKVHSHETPAEAAIRECFEETGIEVTLVRLLQTVEHDYDHGKLRISFLLCEPRVSHAHEPRAPFRWVSRSELNTLRFPEANESVVRLLLAGQE